MTKRDLFKILIKIVGVYAIVLTFSTLLSMFGLFAYGFDWFSLLGVLTSLAAMALFSLFVFKPELIINLFKLDKGFDSDTVDITTNSVTILRLGIIIIGGWLFVSNISYFLFHCYYLLQSTVVNNFLNDYSFTNSDYSNLTMSIADLFIGALLLFNSNPIAKYIWNKESKTEE